MKHIWANNATHSLAPPVPSGTLALFWIVHVKSFMLDVDGPAEAFITPFKAEHNRVEPFIRFIHLKLHHLPTPEVLLASTFNCSDRDDSLRCVMELC